MGLHWWYISCKMNWEKVAEKVECILTTGEKNSEKEKQDLRLFNLWADRAEMVIEDFKKKHGT